MHGAAFEERPFARAFVERFVFAKPGITLNGQLVILECPFGVANTPITEHERLEVVMRPRITLLRG